MTQATGPGGTVTHTFNGDGLKVRRVGPDGTRRYYYDGIRTIWEGSDAGSLLQQYDRDIFGNLLLSRRDSAGVRRYYHHDGLGSTTALTTETGAVAATLLYDAWGNERASTGSNWGWYRFTGAERDGTTGLYHMHARFYDPTIGRWLSEDPVQDRPFEPASLNFYAYVLNNPMLYVDPRGTTEEAPAEKRLREFINALNDLYALIESLIARGQAQLGIGLLNAIGLLGPEATLAILSSANGDPTLQAVKDKYQTAARLLQSAIIGFALAVALARMGHLDQARITAAIAVGMFGRGIVLADEAVRADRKYFGGRVFDSLSWWDRIVIRAIFGRP